MQKTTRGSIFKRGKNYWLQYSINKKRIRVALRDGDNKPITVESQARIAANKIMAPLLAMDEAQRLRLLQSELMSVEERAKEADRE